MLFPEQFYTVGLAALVGTWCIGMPTEKQWTTNF
jgi:hypothetical protein